MLKTCLGLLATLFPVAVLAAPPASPAVPAAPATGVHDTGAPARDMHDTATAGADLPGLIECRQGVVDFARFSVALSDPDGVASLGWTALPQTNQFMKEYRLPQAVTVFGARTDHVALHGGSLMAVLDQADPRPLATRLQLETGFDEADKFIAGREVVSRDIVTPGTGERMIESVILSVSTVQTHPGKTLAGCTYSLDEPDEDADEGMDADTDADAGADAAAGSHVDAAITPAG